MNDTGWSLLHKEFLSAIFSSFDCCGVKYFVLRNYEELPDDNRAKDVDIVIEPRKYGMAKRVILNCMKSYDINYYTVTQFDRMRCWHIMDNGKRFAMHIDIIENEVYKGFEYLRFDYLYERTIPYKSFTVLDKATDTFMLLAQNLVAYKSLKEKYRETIKENYRLCKEDIDTQITSFWGKKVGGHLIELLNTSDFEEIVRYAFVLEKTAMKRIACKRPLFTLKNILRFLSGKAYRIIWCPKRFWRFLAVEAPDGTGKTTFINRLVDELRFYYISDRERFSIHHFRPSLLPNLGAAGEKAGVMKQDKNFTVPHRAKSVGFFSSLIRMTYYWLDYVIGVPYFLRKEVQYARYTIFDRYIYDFIIDPRRSRINLPDWLRGMFAKLVLQPQVVFVLEANPRTIYGRKQELTLPEIERQLLAFGKLATAGKRFVRIDADRTPEEMVNQGIAVLFEKFMNKIEK